MLFLTPPPLGLSTVGSAVAVRHLLAGVFEPASQLMAKLSSFYQFKASFQRVAELVEGWAEPPAVKQGTSVVVKNAVLGHGGRAVLHVESLVLEPGDFLWIRGPTGAGKSTLGKAIAGLIKPLEGSVEAPEGAIYIGNDDYISTGLCMKTSRFGRNTRGRKWKGPRGSPA